MNKNKIKVKKVIIRNDIKEPPTELEKKCILQYGQDVNNKCLDCKKPVYYFNQCDKCNHSMITSAKIMY